MAKFAQIEKISDDPFGSPLMRALDKLPLQAVNTIKDRRIDLTLSNNNLDAAVLFNRITGDERTMYLQEVLFTGDTAITVTTSQYAAPR